MIIPPEIKRLLIEIRRLGREIGVDPRYVADFGRLYRFYMEMESPGLDEQREEQGTAPEPAEDKTSGTASPELQFYLDEAAIARARYAQRIEYYLLLKSFYNAFIFPLEQDIAIARSCQTLGIEAIGFTGGKRITQEELDTLRLGESEQLLAAMRSAFQAIGQASFQDGFNLTDFTSNNLDQN